MDVVGSIMDYKEQLDHRRRFKWCLYGIIRAGEARIYDTGYNHRWRRDIYFWEDDEEGDIGDDVSIVHAVEDANRSTGRIASLLEPSGGAAIALSRRCNVVRLYMRRHGIE